MQGLLTRYSYRRAAQPLNFCERKRRVPGARWSEDGDVKKAAPEAVSAAREIDLRAGDHDADSSDSSVGCSRSGL